jgi:predicted methyltransferase
MNKIALTFGTALALALAGCTSGAEEPAPEPTEEAVSLDALQAAVANPSRPEKARALDESRKPAEVLAFLGLKPGDAAADVISGGGYWAEIMAGALGEGGSVTALEPEQISDDEQWAALTTRAPGVKLEKYPWEKLDAGSDRFDFALLNLIYHDMYWQSDEFGIPESDPQVFVAALYKAMKPGGIVGVIDHVGNAGDTRKTVDDYHRIAPDVVKADFEAAGFILEDESDLLRNPQDDHESSVFDEAIRGKTDRFVYRFRKPAS